MARHGKCAAHWNTGIFFMPWFQVDNRKLVAVQCLFTIWGSKSCLGALPGCISIPLPDKQIGHWKHSICRFFPICFHLRERRQIFFPFLLRQEFGQPMTPTEACSSTTMRSGHWGVVRQACSKQLAINFQSHIRNTYDQTIFSFIHNFQCLITKNTSSTMLLWEGASEALDKPITNENNYD